MIRSYNELIRIPSFVERIEYLRLRGKVGFIEPDRELRTMFYNSDEWKAARRLAILRDNGCDLGVPGYDISEFEKIYVHHINPISIDDIINSSDRLFNPNNLITVSYNTHNIIHYGNRNIKMEIDVSRSPNDTCPWKNAHKGGE